MAQAILRSGASEMCESRRKWALSGSKMPQSQAGRIELDEQSGWRNLLLIGQKGRTFAHLERARVGVATSLMGPAQRWGVRGPSDRTALRRRRDSRRILPILMMLSEISALYGWRVGIFRTPRICGRSRRNTYARPWEFRRPGRSIRKVKRRCRGNFARSSKIRRNRHLIGRRRAARAPRICDRESGPPYMSVSMEYESSSNIRDAS